MRFLLRPWFHIPILFIGLVIVSNQAPALQDKKPAYDIVIRNGKIVDGSGNPWFHGDVAVKGGRIAAMGVVPPGSGQREIDAKGLVVSPGFVDIHAHSEFTLLKDGHAQSKILQGVTTEVFGESSSPGPFQGEHPFPRGVKVKDKLEPWTTLGGYFDAVEKAQIATNVASFVGLGTIWRNVMGDSHKRPTPEQFQKMKELVDEAMRDGAAGLSCCLACTPDTLATTDDIVELCKVVAKHGGIYVTHIRHEGTGVFEAIREAIEIGRRAGITVEILHIKIADQKYWGRMNEVIKLIDDARSQGINVGANVYPYTRGNNNLVSIIPPWAHEGGVAKMLDRIKDPTDRARIKKDIKEGLPGWYNHYTAVGGDWGRMLISGGGSFSGLTMDRVLEARRKSKKTTTGGDVLDEFLDFLSEQGGSVNTVYDHHMEKDMNLAMQQPWCSIGSDGYALATEGPTREGHAHPRSFGTFPRILGVYVRDKGLLRLEDAIRKMTSQNAKKIGVFDRGELRPGNWADITLFDPQRIIDRSTYASPFQYSEGVEYVLVNGQLVLDRGRHTGARPGRALRHQKLQTRN